MPSAIVFAYHNVGARCLCVLLNQGVEVREVITHTDQPGENLWFARVADLAQWHGLPVSTPADPNTPAFVARMAALAPDFIFSFYYRQMLGAPLLALPRRGAYNMHGSLLPRYRGRAPVNWAVLHGERETGASLHEMVLKPDAGSLIDQQAVPILIDDTARDVFDKVTVAAEQVLLRALPRLIDGTAQPRALDLAAGSYFGGRTAADGRIDWRQPAERVHNLIRAVAPPYPGAFCDLPEGRLGIARSRLLGNQPGDGQTVRVLGGYLQVRCGDGAWVQVDGLTLNGARVLPEDLSRWRPW
jgi:methionyl-tRNA formyltransferase